MENKSKIHFIGIGGSSMNGLALIMKKRGHEITGSDSAKSPFTEYLEEEGIAVTIGQSAQNIKNPDIVVHTAAISRDNDELKAAREKGITTIDRATLLGKITKEFKTSVGIAGCHGKTTITSMIGLIAIKADLDPTVHIGGIVPFFKGGGTYIGSDDIFITEACEYENSYLQFDLNMAVINNIDNDHLNFFGSIDNIVSSFLTFAKKLPTSGILIANSDDERVKSIAKSVDCNLQTYGLKDGAMWQAKDIKQMPSGITEFSVYRDGAKQADCVLNVPGVHNVQNALAAIIVCYNLGVPVQKSCDILREYRLTKRRFEHYGSFNGAELIHDYAHHPTELAACIKTAEPLPHKRLIGVFQCHTFSRAINHLKEFGKVLSTLDEAIITDIYPAREIDEGKIHARDIVESINESGGNAVYISDFNGVKKHLLKEDLKDCIILAMGAGDIGEKIKVLLD